MIRITASTEIDSVSISINFEQIEQDFITLGNSGNYRQVEDKALDVEKALREVIGTEVLNAIRDLTQTSPIKYQPFIGQS